MHRPLPVGPSQPLVSLRSSQRGLITAKRAISDYSSVTASGATRHCRRAAAAGAYLPLQRCSHGRWGACPWRQRCRSTQTIGFSPPANGTTIVRSGATHLCATTHRARVTVAMLCCQNYSYILVHIIPRDDTYLEENAHDELSGAVRETDPALLYREPEPLSLPM